MCDLKGYVLFQPFWSEIGNRFWQFWSQIMYSFYALVLIGYIFLEEYLFIIIYIRPSTKALHTAFNISLNLETINYKAGL